MKTRNPYQERKQQQATAREVRRLAREERGEVGQLRLLDMMFGVGKGAKKERAKIMKRLHPEQVADYNDRSRSQSRAEEARCKNESKTAHR